MRFKKAIPLLPVLILDSIINILYFADIIPEWIFRIGFIVVMFCSIIMNILNSRDSRKAGSLSGAATYKQSKEAVSKWYTCLYIISLLLWIASYAIATFLK